MSDKTELNPELSELEHSLKGLAVPACPLNRDELMYRSGWEAALASSRDAVQVELSSKGMARHWLLPTVSVLSSAAAILFGILLWNQNENRGEAGLRIARNVPAEVGSADPVATEKAEVPNNELVEVPDLLRMVMELPINQTLHVGLVVGPNYPVEPERSFDAPGAPSSRKLTPPMTQQELMDELLPNRFDRSPQWSLFRMGGNS